MSLRRARKKVDYSKFCDDEGESTNNSDGKEAFSIFNIILGFNIIKQNEVVEFDLHTIQFTFP